MKNFSRSSRKQQRDGNHERTAQGYGSGDNIIGVPGEGGKSNYQAVLKTL